MFRKRFVSCVSLSVALLVCLSAVEVAQASPWLSIGDGKDKTWLQEFGNVVGAAFTAPAQAFYTNLVNNDANFDSYAFWPNGGGLSVSSPLLVADQNNVQHDSLVMGWYVNPNDARELAIAAWRYDYPADPDLSGATVGFSVMPPPGILDVSMELVDVNGNARGWFMPTPAVGLWNSYQIVANNAGPQGPFTFFQEDVGFDITQVVGIQLGEAGNTVFWPTPIVVNGTVMNWNAWNHLEVTGEIPEPATMAMSALALTALGGYLRRRRRPAAR